MLHLSIPCFVDAQLLSLCEVLAVFLNVWECVNYLYCILPNKRPWALEIHRGVGAYTEICAYSGLLLHYARSWYGKLGLPTPGLTSLPFSSTECTNAQFC